MKLWDWAHQVVGARVSANLPIELWKATRDEISRIASPCPICKTKDLANHHFGEFASQIAVVDSKDLAEFFELYRARRWQELHQIREFDGRYNAAILYAFFCLQGSCMLAVRNPVELYDCDDLLGVTVLDDQEASMIKGMQIETHPL